MVCLQGEVRFQEKQVRLAEAKGSGVVSDARRMRAYEGEVTLILLTIEGITNDKRR